MPVPTILAGRYTVHALLGKRPGRATYHCITAPNRHVAVKLLDPALDPPGDDLARVELFAGFVGV